MIGEQIGNHRILAKIGQGGMGTVYQAEDTTLGRKVAIKFLNPSTAEGGKELERFQAEAKVQANLNHPNIVVQANLNHPNIVTLHAFEKFREGYCMVMEYVEGRTLSDIVRRSGPLPPHVAVTIVRQVLEGLSAAHRAGVVHRDLKPSNIMLTSEGIAKVMDFGIAKVQGTRGLTTSGALMGTVYYMSPEQVRGEQVDARSDLYSLGIILFELLTGRVPFKDDSEFQIMIHHVQTPPPPPTQLLPDVPAALEQVVLKCLAKNQPDRYQSADEVAAALESFEEQERIAGRGHLYTRKMLVQWLAAQESEKPQAPATGPVRPLVASPPGTAKSRPSSEVPPMQQPQASPPRKGLLLAVSLVLIVLAAGAATLYLKRDRAQALLGSMTGTPESQPAPTSQETPAALNPAQTEAALAPGMEAAPAAGTQARQAPALSEAKDVAPEAPVAAAGAAPPAPATTWSAAGRTPARTSSPAGLKTAAPQNIAPSRQPAEPLPRGFLIFVDPDQGSERLPLALAQARVAEVIREHGYEVISSGVAANEVRAALDRKDLAAIRRGGIGYVVFGTASVTLERQTAYGSVYNVASASANLELVRLSDGAVAAVGSGEAKSRGSANPGAAVSEALLTATSDAARSMMRQFRP